jgi:hypothetical protein
LAKISVFYYTTVLLKLQDAASSEKTCIFKGLGEIRSGDAKKGLLQISFYRALKSFMLAAGYFTAYERHLPASPSSRPQAIGSLEKESRKGIPVGHCQPQG